jgi:hypothetical protein
MKTIKLLAHEADILTTALNMLKDELDTTEDYQVLKLDVDKLLERMENIVFNTDNIG